MRLKDKVAIVTGGAAGIGREFVLGLPHEGVKVVIGEGNTIRKAIESVYR
jgi:NAD(P)-dependent dehydrogenase (short-subunit alcohol dehydrogenase family)